MPNNTKTKAKRMGIKSVLAHGKDEQGRTKLALTAGYIGRSENVFCRS